jgi:general secretion pathway protein J
MRCPADPGAHQAGFTLPEMLVGLAIMALVSVVLFAGIGRIGIANALTSRGDALVDDIHSAQFLLRDRLERVVPLADPQAGSAVDLAGTAESLDFIGYAPDRAAPDAAQRYRLALNSQGALMLYQLSTLDDRIDAHGPDVTGWNRVQLLGGASALSLRYFGSDPATGTTDWQTGWSHRPTLPMAVAIRVSFPEGDPRAWPDLVIHPRAATSDGCRRDIRTDQCGGGA